MAESFAVSIDAISDGINTTMPFSITGTFADVGEVALTIENLTFGHGEVFIGDAILDTVADTWSAPFALRLQPSAEYRVRAYGYDSDSDLAALASRSFTTAPRSMPFKKHLMPGARDVTTLRLKTTGRVKARKRRATHHVATAGYSLPKK